MVSTIPVFGLQSLAGRCLRFKVVKYISQNEAVLALTLPILTDTRRDICCVLNSLTVSSTKPQTALKHGYLCKQFYLDLRLNFDKF